MANIEEGGSAGSYRPDIEILRRCEISAPETDDTGGGGGVCTSPKATRLPRSKLCFRICCEAYELDLSISKNRCAAIRRGNELCWRGDGFEMSGEISGLLHGTGNKKERARQVKVSL